MKSREYRSIDNKLIYWLEDNRVMVRDYKGKHVMESVMTAAQFFVMVGNDSLVLID